MRHRRGNQRCLTALRVPNLETICCEFMSRGGLQLAEDVAALISLLGLALTIFVPSEARGRSLEELSGASV